MNHAHFTSFKMFHNVHHTNLKVDDLSNCFEDTPFVGHVKRLEDVRKRGIEASNPLDGCFKVQEAFFLEESQE